MIVEELSDYFFIFGKSDKVKNMLLLNSENDNFNYEIFNNVKINKFAFLENDLENIELLNNGIAFIVVKKSFKCKSLYKNG
jgi:hypothetical protein